MSVCPATTMSVLTPRGRGAIAVVRLQGPAAGRAIQACFSATHQNFSAAAPIDRIYFGRWQSGEELVVCRTANDTWEVHCHGGTAAVEAICRSLANTNEVERSSAAPVEWSRQPLDQEAEQLLPAAITLRGAEILLDQMQGALTREIDRLRQFVSQKDGSAALVVTQALIAQADIGLHVTQPWRVVLAGPPNVGKSSLKNRLVGFDRSIVYSQPGTTRDVIRTLTAVEGWPLELSDTAGIRASDDPIEAEGVRRTGHALDTADLVLWVHDPATLNGRDHTDLLPRECRAHELRILNKSDLVSSAPSPGLSTIDIAVSALSGEGLAPLLQLIAERLVPHPPEPAAPIPFTRRQVDHLSRVVSHLMNHQFAEAVVELDQLVAGSSPHGS